MKRQSLDLNPELTGSAASLSPAYASCSMNAQQNIEIGFCFSVKIKVQVDLPLCIQSAGCGLVIPFVRINLQNPLLILTPLVIDKHPRDFSSLTSSPGIPDLNHLRRTSGLSLFMGKIVKFDADQMTNRTLHSEENILLLHSPVRQPVTRVALEYLKLGSGSWNSIV